MNDKNNNNTMDADTMFKLVLISYFQKNKLYVYGS